MVAAPLVKHSIEFDDVDYFQEVLQLQSGQTDIMIENKLREEAKRLGIVPETINSTPENLLPPSPPESVIGTSSGHVPPISSYSQNSHFTGTSPPESDNTSEKEAPINQKPKFSLIPEKNALHYSVNPISLMTENLRPAPYSFLKYQSSRKLTNCLHVIAFKPRVKQTCPKSNDSCARCRKLLEKDLFHTLACYHNYCITCLRKIITKASKTRFKIPAQCCSQLIPGSVIKSVLDEEEQVLLLHSLLHLRSLRDRQKYYPDSSCSEKVPDLQRVISNRTIFKYGGKSDIFDSSLARKWTYSSDSRCPSDMTLDVKPTERTNRKPTSLNCFSVNLAKTSLCSLKFHQEPTVLPNIGHVPKEVDEYRVQPEGRNLHHIKISVEDDELNFYRQIIEGLKWDEKKSEEQVFECVELSALRARQVNERDRFRAYERKMRWFMMTRHDQERIQAFRDFEEKIFLMEERHAITLSRLEDKQVADEMELRSSLMQVEKNVLTRLRHMEAYCEATGHDGSDTDYKRVVTERDLRQLGQQYNTRDNMDRMHQSKIKVMRDKQTRQLEMLVVQHERELNEFMSKRKDIMAVEQRFQEEKDKLSEVFAKRRASLQHKWKLEEEILRKKLMTENNFRFIPIRPPIEWPLN